MCKALQNWEAGALCGTTYQETIRDAAAYKCGTMHRKAHEVFVCIREGFACDCS